MDGAEALLALEASHAPVRVVKAGAAIYRQGDAPDQIYNLVSGWVGLQHDQDDGRRGLLHIALPGDIFGLEPNRDGLGHAATAFTDCAVCAIGVERHRRLRLTFPSFNERFIWMLERNVQFANETLEILATGGAAAKVAYLLWSLAVRSLRRRPQPFERIWAPVQQIDLAAATGLTPVHVSRVLGDLRSRGILSFRSPLLILRNPAAVEAIFGGSREVLGLWSELKGPRPPMLDRGFEALQ
jgi:CRP-like cAMP-binding protein